MDAFHDPYQPSNLFDFQSPSNFSTGMYVPEGRGTQPVKQGMRDIHDLNMQMNQEQEKQTQQEPKKGKKQTEESFEDSDSDEEETDEVKKAKKAKKTKKVKSIEGFEDGFRSLSNGFYLVLIYLVISSNYLGNLFGCRVQQMLNTNVYMKHLLGFFTTYFFIVLATPPEGSTNMSLLGFAALIYGWFFITTKMSVTYWIPMILCVLLAYFLYQYNRQEDESLRPEVKQRIQVVQSVLTTIAGILTVVGVVMYYGEKKLEYGPGFQPSEFWFGLPSCKNKTPNFTMGNRFRAAFN
jgi:hypothetical protein